MVKARSLPGVETRHSNIDTVNSSIIIAIHTDNKIMYSQKIKCFPKRFFYQEQSDKVIVRESTEGEYSAIEHESVRGVVECLKVKFIKFKFGGLSSVLRLNLLKLNLGGCRVS